MNKTASAHEEEEKTGAITESPITPNELQKMRAMFIEFDSNDSGFLDQDAFIRLVAATSMLLSEAEIEKLRLNANESNSGLVSMKEFMQCVPKMGLFAETVDAS